MRRLLILAALFCVPAAMAATPALIQRVDYSVVQSGSAITDLFGSHTIKYILPNTSIAGNAYVVCEAYGSTSVTATISDGTNTYTLATTLTDSSNGDRLKCWYALNVAAIQPTISVVLSGTGNNNTGHAHGFVAEFSNITAIDGAACTGALDSTSTTIACTGAIGATGDLLVQFGNMANPGNATAFTAGAGWTKSGSDRMLITDSHMWQWRVAAGSTTPSFTVAPTNQYLTIGLAFTSGTSGGALPAGIIVTDVQGNGDDNATGDTSPFTIDAPCPATTNLIVGSWVGASGDLSSVSGSVSGSWVSVQAAASNPASGTLHQFYKAAATTSPSDILTLTSASSPSLGDTFVVLCVQGAATSPLDTQASTTGNKGATGAFNVVSIVPSTSNGLVVGVVGVASNTLTPSAWTPGVWDPPDENNDWGHYYNPSASSVQFNVTGRIGAPGNWASQAVAFKAAAAGAVVRHRAQVIQ